MALNPSNLGRRYAPLVALAVVQLILVALAPSNGGTSAAGSSTNFNPTAAAGSGASLESGGAAGSATGATGGAVGGATGAATTGGAAGGATGATGGAVGGTTGGAATGGAGGATTAAAKPGATAGATSGSVTAASGGAPNPGCVNGHQAGPSYYMPPCTTSYTPQPVASMQGVTPTAINYVYYLPQGNAEVNAILQTENLAATTDDECLAIKTFTDELNKRWELYGRKFVSLDGTGKNSGKAQGDSTCTYNYWQGQCNLTPPDIPCLQAEADAIAALKPAFVIAVGEYDQFYIRLAQDHVIVIGGTSGGENIPENYFDQLAPYYYNIFPNGTQVAQQVAEYYCKKLVGKPAQYAGKGAGDVIPVTGQAPIRKLGIIYPENNGDTTYKQTADYLEQLVNGCGAQGTQEYSYASDITTAQQQTATTVAAIKQAGITTIVMLGDPIAPVFTTNGLDQQGYHPEFLLSGTGLIDYDVLGQLYNKNEMSHAFGLSDLTDSIAFNQTEAPKAWADSGDPGSPDPTQNLNWGYFEMMGNIWQLAGPAPTPTTIAQGVRSATFPGNAQHEAIQFADPFPWTGEKDFREVYWCGTTTSPYNNQPGEYIDANGGKRFVKGSVPPGTSELFPNGECAG
ncbi:MAG TPA: hypothetical protein VFP61_00725 [Acidimicrobiales bacterium]|nr:hypothetical protein [Acidimicrobiales bacterium]